jgi:protein-S-isoprenylcysteine O-methyltransferase Ste14
MDNSKTIVIAVVLIIASIAFPLWVSEFLEKHGRSDLARLTRFSIRTGLGLLAGFFGLVMLLFKPPEVKQGHEELEISYSSESSSDSNSDNVAQYNSRICPSCGSNRTINRTMLEDVFSPERKLAINQFRISTKVGKYLILLGIFAIAFAIGIVLFMITNSISGSLTFPLLIFIIGIFLLWAGITSIIGHFQEKDKKVVEEYGCKECFKKWDVREIRIKD